MANKKFPRNKPITIPVQKYNIRKQFKSMIINEKHGIGLKMLLRIQPTEFSKKYKVLLHYDSIQKRPQVYIDIKQLEVEDKEKIPHIYGIKELNGIEYANLCLYYPGEWSPTMRLTDTIIPWISEWIYFYEFWRITGEWYGGGKHPASKDIKKNDRISNLGQ